MSSTSPQWYQELRYWQNAGYTDGFCYVIRGCESGNIKVGKAFDPEARLREHQTSTWESLELLHVLPGYGRTEVTLHRRLADSRIRGEWFGGPAIKGFLKWVEDEAAKAICRHQERGELPMSGKAPRTRSRKVTGTYTGRGLRRSLRMKPTEDAPVTIRFVDPDTLRADKAA